MLTQPSCRPVARRVLSNWTGTKCWLPGGTRKPGSPRRSMNVGKFCMTISKRCGFRQMFRAVMLLEALWFGLMVKRHSNQPPAGRPGVSCSGVVARLCAGAEGGGCACGANQLLLGVGPFCFCVEGGLLAGSEPGGFGVAVGVATGAEVVGFGGVLCPVGGVCGCGFCVVGLPVVAGEGCGCCAAAKAVIRSA